MKESGSLKILFQTQHRDTASTSLLLSHLEFLERLYPVEVMKFASNYCQADVILFMGYDPDFAGVRASGSNAVVGVVDPRGPFDVDLQNADFVIANGIEMRDWCLNVVPQVHVHYLYPVLPESVAGSRSDSPFRVGYHGNRVHIEEMKQRILPALNRLSEQTSVELVLLYNIEQLGRCDSLEDGRSDRVSLQHVQLTTESYSEV
ncbi:MAG: hypothetical protein KDD70_19100, partial [Bdellovibrionales bacterium]|nr:hypothetical protein [Bdellovibrionales bacterium]